MTSAEDNKCYVATPRGTLIEQIMDPNQPKTEREWAAKREIEALQARAAELEKANYVYRSTATDVIKMVEAARDALAARVVELEAVAMYQQQYTELDDKMFASIENAARVSFQRHQRSVRGQQLTMSDSYESHLVWAAQAQIKAERDALAAELAAARAQEPVARVNTYDVNTLDWLDMSGALGCGTSLFAAPIPPVRGPLIGTLLEIACGMRTRAINNVTIKSSTLEMFADEIEAAIKEQK